MRFWLWLIGAFALLIVMGQLLSAAAGIVFWVGVIALIGTIAGALIRKGSIDGRLHTAPGKRAQRKIDRTADRSLKELERRVNKQ